MSICFKCKKEVEFKGDYLCQTCAGIEEGTNVAKTIRYVYFWNIYERNENGSFKDSYKYDNPNTEKIKTILKSKYKTKYLEGVEIEKYPMFYNGFCETINKLTEIIEPSYISKKMENKVSYEK